MIDDKAVERAARAIYETRCGDGQNYYTWGDPCFYAEHPDDVDRIYEEARAALEAPLPQEGWQTPEGYMLRTLAEWHEDDGFVVWWALKNGRWLGEPAYIGSPLCDDWPDYHTHWTPHPAFPPLPVKESPK